MLQKNTYANVRNTSVAMLSLTCSKLDQVVADEVLLAPTISHMLSSTLYGKDLIDGYTNLIDGFAPWYNLNKEKYLDSTFLKKKLWSKGDIYAPILVNFIITGHTLHDQAKCCLLREELETGYLPTKFKFCLSNGRVFAMLIIRKTSGKRRDIKIFFHNYDFYEKLTLWSGKSSL